MGIGGSSSVFHSKGMAGVTVSRSTVGQWRAHLEKSSKPLPKDQTEKGFFVFRAHNG